MRPGTTRRAAATAVAVALLAAGCTTHHSSAAPPATTSTTSSTSTSTPPARGSGIAWAPCAGHAGWDCGNLSVPLDHADPAGPKITIALNRHRATDPAHRVGTLLINPGGPGASGIDFAYNVVPGLLDTDLIADFDIVGFDPRGVGASTPIECVSGPTLDRINHLDPVPSTPAKLAALINGSKELAAGCEAESGRLLAHVSTVDAAEDMDDIRAAVGDAKLTYLGFSYGTLLGATYANLFPTHVRALALDSAIDPAVDEATMSLDQAVGFEGDLNAFLQWCATPASDCAFKAEGAASLRAEFNALAASIGNHALPADNGRTLGPGELVLGVAAPLYDQSTWPDLGAALAAAQGGNGEPLIELFDEYAGRNADGTYDNEEVSNVAINCLDLPAPSISQVQALEPTAAREAPYFGPPLNWDDLNCLYWPVPPVTTAGPIHAPGAPPILVVGSTGDPATPYEWAQALASELGSGVLITRHGEGHGAYPVSSCVRSIVDKYLITLAVPPPASRTCAS